MKTVKDYKDAGLVFVKDDYTVETDGSTNKGKTAELCVDFHFNKCSGFDDSEVGGFAWRTSTGVNPEFKGVVEIEWDDGDVEVVDYTPNWGIVAKWRPHMPSIQTETPEEKAALDKIDAHVSGEAKPEIYGPTQKPYPKLDVDAIVKSIKKSEDDFKAKLMKVDFASSLKRPFEGKPVYTQAMCDAGELPMIGSECMFSHNGSPWRECFIVGMDQGGEDLVVQSFEYLFFSGNTVKFKPIQTEREKAIDEITGEWPHACKSTIELMLDAGYSK